MTYEFFAQVYDELMDDTLYTKWVDYTNQYISKGDKLLELGCGTGKLGIQLKREGYDVTGIDLSSDMLSLAYNYQQESGIHFPLYECDMRDLSGLGSYDAIISFCDSICYLEKREDVMKVFSEAFNKLKAEGNFLFDVHSTHQIDKFVNFSLHDELKNIVFLWDSYEGEFSYSIEHHLSFFKKKSNGDYQRVQEVHIERTYPIEDYCEMLAEAGFSNIEVLADFNQKVNEKSKRWFFKAEK